MNSFSLLPIPRDSFNNNKMLTENKPSVPPASRSQAHQAQQSNEEVGAKSETRQSPLITVRCSKRKRFISTRIAETVHELPPSVVDNSFSSDETHSVRGKQVEDGNEEAVKIEMLCKDTSKAEITEIERAYENAERSRQAEVVGNGAVILPGRSGGLTTFHSTETVESSSCPPQSVHKVVKDINEVTVKFVCVFCKCEINEAGDMALLSLEVPLPGSQLCPLSLLHSVDVAFSLDPGGVSKDKEIAYLCSYCFFLVSKVDEAFANLKNLTSQMKKLWSVDGDLEIPKTNLGSEKMSSGIEQSNSNVIIQPVQKNFNFISKKSRLEVEIYERKRKKLTLLNSDNKSGDCGLCGEDMRRADKWLWRMHLSGYHRTGFMCNNALSSWCLSSLITEDLKTLNKKAKDINSKCNIINCVACDRCVEKDDFMKHVQVYHKIVIDKGILAKETKTDKHGSETTRLRTHDEMTEDETRSGGAEENGDAAIMKNKSVNSAESEGQSPVEDHWEDTIIISDKREAKKCKTRTQKTVKKSSVQTRRRRKTIRQAASSTRRYMCKYCPRKFPTPEDRDVHYSAEHSSEDTNPSMSWQCKICYKRFPTYSPYRLHKAYVHSTELYVCDICGATYKMKSYLTDHQKRNHWSKNPYNKGSVLCEECGKTFKRKSDLTEHHKQVHREKETLKCSHCRKCYQSRLQLRRHLMRKHDIPWEETLTPRFTRNLKERRLLDRGMCRIQQKADDNQNSEDDLNIQQIEIFEIDSLQENGMMKGEEEGRECVPKVCDPLLEKELEAEILTTLDNSHFLSLEDEQEFNVLHVSESPAVTNIDIDFAGPC